MNKKYNILPVFLSGYRCRYACTYCNASGSSGISDIVIPKNLTIQIRRWLETTSKHGIRQVAFYGIEPTSIDRNRFMKLVRVVRDFIVSGDVQDLRISIRPDTVCTLGDILDMGVRVVELGVPSMNRDVLKRIRRQHTPQAVTRAVQFLKSKGISIGFQAMLGLPGSSAAVDMESARRLAALKPDFVRIHPTLVLARSGLAADFNQGRFQPLELDEAVDRCADVSAVFLEENIPIARTGFHIPERLKEDCLVAGPHHPAFGTLVRSRLCLREMMERIKCTPGIRRINVAPNRLPDYIGYRCENLILLRREIHPEFRICPEPDGTAVRENEVLGDD
ncbi:radical SAM protein [bacterium]|nr:radical SAM protein [candidate division CSSED10-310 bacterium]